MENSTGTNFVAASRFSHYTTNWRLGIRGTAAQKPFSGRKALVVGGTGGIGKAVALALAEKGAELTVHGGSSGERLESTLRAIKEEGAKGEGFLLFIDGPKAAAEILARSPAPDILVCAWGPFKQGKIVALDMKFWQDMVESNLIFPGILVSRVLAGMMERNWGRILLFGGTNTDTIKGFTTTIAYSAAKTALGVIAKSTAKAAGSRGVTCNVLCPGLTDTEYTTEELRSYNREKSPGGEVLSPRELAIAALAILENPCLNGAIIPVDNGISL
jgi:3-oxoacyl-[acyl-carrier protein] reductase